MKRKVRRCVSWRNRCQAGVTVLMKEKGRRAKY
uniref:Uncharacterized protein n=1 Tax=Anguilla anguilla TaxID=7936 RepID=A0A0E9PK94_ANGAN